MPKVHHVLKARKAIKSIGVNKGEPYFWWKKRLSPKGPGIVIKSKERPKQSQLTSSAFWSAVFSVQENASQPSDVDDLEGSIDNIKDELQNILDETQEKLDNMPEGLQQGSTGEMLQERIDAVESAISDLDSIDPEWCDDYKEEGEDVDEAKERWLSEKWQEVTYALEGISCS